MRKRLFIILAVASVLCACEPESARRLSGTGNIAIELGQSVLTRAEGAVDGSKMNNLHIWLVGSDGSIKDYIDGTVAYVDDNTRYCTIDAGGATAKALFTNVEKGNYTLYFVANLPSGFPLDRYQKGGTIDDSFKDRLLANVVDNQPPYDETSGMPLSLVKSISVGAGTNSLTGELVRTCARIRLTVRNNTVSNTLILRKIALSTKGNPSTGYLFPREKFSIPGTASMGPFNSLELTKEGETTDIVIPHGETHTYIDQYMYETGLNGSVSLGFNIAGGLFADGVTSGVMGQVETGSSGTKTVYTANGTSSSSIVPGTYYLIKSNKGGYFLYDDDDGSGKPKATSETTAVALMSGENPEKYLWSFSATGTANIRNVKTGNYLIIGTDNTVSMSTKASTANVSSNTGSGFRLYNGSSTGGNGNNKVNNAYTLSITASTVSIITNQTTGKESNVTPSSDPSCYLQLYRVTFQEVPVPSTELNLKDNNGNAAEKYFDQTISSLNYIGKYGTPVPLKHIYRNQDVQIVVNVHYNPSSGVLYFETTDWEKDDNNTTFD